MVPPAINGGRNSNNERMNPMSNSNTLERNRSTPNNTMNSLNSQTSKEFTGPNVTVSSSTSSTLERPPNLFVNRSIELLQEKGVGNAITGRNQQSFENESNPSSLSQPIIKTAQNSCDSNLEVCYSHISNFIHFYFK